MRSSLSKEIIREFQEELKQTMVDTILDEIKENLKQPLMKDLEQSTFKSITDVQQQVTNKYKEINKQLQVMYTTQTNMHHINNTNTDCPICLNRIDIDNYVVLPCAHNFCFSCLNQQRKHECAICR